MIFKQYLGKNIRVIFVDGQILEGHCNSFTDKLDTDDGLYDELTIRVSKHPYVSFNESEVRQIENI